MWEQALKRFRGIERQEALRAVVCERIGIQISKRKMSNGDR